jgi:hypothetical protein
VKLEGSEQKLTPTRHKPIREQEKKTEADPNFPKRRDQLHLLALQLDVWTKIWPKIPVNCKNSLEKKLRSSIKIYLRSFTM